MVWKSDCPEVPFVAYLDTEWIQKITIKGRAPANASRFTIYLQNGEESEPDDVAFVLDFRFDFGGHIRRIVTNHKREGAWQAEEGDDCEFPLCEEEDFKIKISVEEDCFIVKVNGQTLLDFEQRCSCRTINCLRIDNDVQLYQVKLK